jgi:hypothetical protein
MSSPVENIIRFTETYNDSKDLSEVGRNSSLVKVIVGLNAFLLGGGIASFLGEIGTVVAEEAVVGLLLAGAPIELALATVAAAGAATVAGVAFVLAKPVRLVAEQATQGEIKIFDKIASLLSSNGISEEQNPDGSTTTHITNADGSIIDVTTWPDGLKASPDQSLPRGPVNLDKNLSLIDVFTNAAGQTVVRSFHANGTLTNVTSDASGLVSVTTDELNEDGSRTIFSFNSTSGTTIHTFWPDGSETFTQRDANDKVVTTWKKTGQESSIQTVFGTTDANDPQPTLIGGDGTDLLVGYGGATILGGNGTNLILYDVPIIDNPQKQAAAKIVTGNGTNLVLGLGPAEINLGNGNDLVLPGFGSVVNAGQGKDVIFAADDVQLNGLKPDDRINLLGIVNLTGGVQWVGSEDPFAYGTDARYGLNQQGDLVIQDYLGDTMFVANYQGGPSVAEDQQTAGIFVAQVGLAVEFLLDPDLPQGWLWGQMAFVEALDKAFLGPGLAIYGGVDPLVFDLAGNGINLTDASSTAPVFDMHGNGFAVHTGWVEPGSGDGILVLDRNGASQISNIDQLIGGQATAGDVSAVGFAQLAQYDANLDGVIDANDPIYSQLRIWVDSDGSGTGELLTLQQAGIASINLADMAQSGDMVAGNQILATGSFTRTDGSTAEVADVSFHTDNFDTTFAGNTTASAAAAALPNLKGYGTLTDLQVAMTNDPALADPALGPSLMSVVEATLPTLSSLDLPTLRADITPILTAWATAVPGIDLNGNPLTIATQSHAEVPILVSIVSTDATGATTVVDFAYEVTDAQGSYWALASGDAVTDANGKPIARPTLVQVEAQAAAEDSWTTFSGAQLDFMARYTGDPIPLGTGAPLDPGTALQAAISRFNGVRVDLAVADPAVALAGGPSVTERRGDRWPWRSAA